MSTVPASAVRTPLHNVRREQLARFGFVGIFLAAVLYFSAMEPDLFFTWENVQILARQAALGSVIAFGLTFVLTVKDFDLTGPSVIGVTVGLIVHWTVESGLEWPIAMILALAISVGVGLLNGLLISVIGLSSIIATLATGALVRALEYWSTGRKQISGAPDGFRELSRAEWGFLEAPVLVAVVFGVLAWVLLEKTEYGRRVRAVGGNPSAAGLSGVRITRIRILTLMLSAFAASVTGVMLAANSGAYSPDPGFAYFIPSFAAVFLGGAIGRNGEFNIPGTALGLVFLTVIRNGFQLMSVDVWLANVIAGVLIVLSVVVSRIGRSADETVTLVGG